MDQVKSSNAISVDAGTMVTMSYARFEALKNVEADKERYATQIAEGSKNFAAADLRAKKAEDQLVPLQNQLIASQEAFKASEDEKQTFAAEWAEDISAIKQATSTFGILQKTEEGWTFTPTEEKKKTGIFGGRSVREKAKDKATEENGSTSKKSSKK